MQAVIAHCSRGDAHVARAHQESVMNSNSLVSIEDSELEQVAGGLGFTIGLEGRLIGLGVGVDFGRGGLTIQAGANVGRLKLGVGLGVSLFGW
jgi:hypothetical protein